MILIVVGAEGFDSALIHRRLLEKGATAQLMIVDDLLGARYSAWVDSASAVRTRIERDGRVLELERVETVWYRDFNTVDPDERLDPSYAEWAHGETNAFAWSLSGLLANRFCVNPLLPALAQRAGNGKLSQLEVARQVGLRVPRTMVTNNPDAAKQFLASCPDGAIYKPFKMAVQKDGDGELRLFTTRVDLKSAEPMLESIEYAPCIFQELLPKAADLRVTVMGQKVFATAIHSQGNAAASVDFRRDYALDKTPYLPHELPQELVQRCLQFVAALGLVFGALDFVLTPDGRYVFLEANENGQFLWLEEQTGQPLLENFCELLMQGRPDFRCDAAIHEPRRFPRAA